MRDGAGLSGGVLKGGDLRAEDELLRQADSLNCRKDFQPDFIILAGEIEHRDGLRIAV